MWRIETKQERPWSLVPAEVRLEKAKARLRNVDPRPRSRSHLSHTPSRNSETQHFSPVIT